jgi:cell division septation protein DedD
MVVPKPVPDRAVADKPVMDRPVVDRPVVDPGELQIALSPRPAPRPQPAARAPIARVPFSAPPGVVEGHYVVQVGSFQVPENAQTAHRRLSDGGYHAYLFQWTDDQQRLWHVVRVSGFESEDDARQALDGVKGLLNLTPMLFTR